MAALKILNPTCFPISFQMSSRLLDDFRECELGSYEDYVALLKGTDEDAAEAEGNVYGDVHGYEILGRWLNLHATRSKIELLDMDEVAEIYYRACSGTFQIADHDRTNGKGLAAARRIADRLRPVLQESKDPDHAELLRRWPEPTGY